MFIIALLAFIYSLIKK
ncbi:hypothetical protein [Lacrimispora xylanisolvens]